MTTVSHLFQSTTLAISKTFQACPPFRSREKEHVRMRDAFGYTALSNHRVQIASYALVLSSDAYFGLFCALRPAFIVGKYILWRFLKFIYVI
jgi:hypothetical protein